VKIIFITTKALTFNTFLESQAKYLIKKNFQIEVVCADTQNINFKNLPTHSIEFPLKFKNFFNIFRYIKIILQIRKLIKKNNKEIFYLHTPLASHIFRLFTFFNKLKIIYFVHGFRFTSKTNFIKSLFFKNIEYLLSYNTNVFLTINNEDYNYAKNMLSKKALYYKLNGVGLNLPLRYFKKKIKKKIYIKKILVIAAYKFEKGYLDILQVADKLKDKGIKIQCYGYGNYSSYNLIKIKKKINNIKFNKFDLNLKKNIQHYDILLHLSKREGLPVAVMESLSNGLPVLCYDIRGNNDLIKNGINGYFSDTVDDVVKKILYLNLNIDLFNKMRIAAFRSINAKYRVKEINYNLYKIIKKFLKFEK